MLHATRHIQRTFDWASPSQAEHCDPSDAGVNEGLMMRADRQITYSGGLHDWPPTTDLHDRNTITVDRVGNHADEAPHRFVIVRRDTVEVRLSDSSRKVGTVVGISHARNKVRVRFDEDAEVSWFPKARVYPADIRAGDATSSSVRELSVNVSTGHAAPFQTASFQEVSEYRTGELIRDILRMQDDTFFPLTLVERLESVVRLQDLPNLSLDQLATVSPTFGYAELRTLLAAVELGRRVAESKLSQTNFARLSSTETAKAFCLERFQRLIQDGVKEEFHILTLNTKNRFINSHQISVGTLDASLVHPREVFRPAIRDSAASIIAVHNHPSGDPTPSKEDRSVTRRLEESGRTLGIDVLDHIIVARNGAMSLREC